jgi:hypothetical protein
MSFGKSGGTQVTTPELTPEQRQQIDAQNRFFTETIAPTYQQAVKGATSLYEQGSPGVTNAAQNLAGYGRQAQQSLGETGESALRTGISGLQSLFTPEYERNQIAAAMSGPQQQYMQNIAQQEAQFGGAGNLGSSRQALAGQQLAGQNAALQASTAAQIQRDIAAQRAGVGSTLAQLGQGGLGQGLGAAGQVVSASMVPQDLFNKYASVIFGAPAASYNLGPVGENKSGSSYNFGAKFQ